MALIADILLIAGALAAAFYCLILSRRLRRFSDLEKGVGGAVAVLSVQVDDMNRTIRQAEKAAADSAVRLNALTERSESAARRLELMLAAMHDLPVEVEADAAAEADPAPAAPTPPAPEAAAAPAGPPPAPAPARTIFSSRRNLGGQAA